jgi:hypothetical protein
LSLQIGGTKGTGRDVLHGHLHEAIDFSVGSDAHNADDHLHARNDPCGFAQDYPRAERYPERTTLHALPEVTPPPKD